MTKAKFWPMISGQKGKMAMSIRARQLPPTMGEQAAATMLICSQLEDGDSDNVMFAVSSYLSRLIGDYPLQLGLENIRILEIAKILREEYSASGIYQRFCEEWAFGTRWEKFYPFITEPELKGLKWKSEKVFELPISDSDSSDGEQRTARPDFIDAVRYLSSALEEGHPLGLDLSFSLNPKGGPCTLRIMVVPKQG